VVGVWHTDTLNTAKMTTEGHQETNFQAQISQGNAVPFVTALKQK
jgi:hypothetical protein